MKTPAEVIESLKKDKLIQNKTYAPSNQDDLAEIIGSSWARCGENKDTLVERLQVLMPEVKDFKTYISQIEKNGENLAAQAEIIKSDDQEESVITNRNFIAKAKEERVQFSEDKQRLEEAKNFLKFYDQRKEKYEKQKKNFSVLDEKIYNEIKKTEAVLFNERQHSVNEDVVPINEMQMPLINSQIVILEQQARKLGPGIKQDAILSITEKIKKAFNVYNLEGSVENLKKSIEEAKGSADQVMPVLDQSFKNSILNFFTKISNAFSTIRTATTHTDSAKKMTEMKKMLSDLLPSPEEHQTSKPK